jgi:hypothetical protein
MSRRSAKRPRFSVGGQPVFENEDSSNHSGLGITDYDENSLSQQPETSTNSSDQHHFPQHQFVPERSKRIQRPLTKSSNEDNTNLNICLDYLFRLLSRKDKEGFFQYPVTDQVKIFNKKKENFYDSYCCSLHLVILKSLLVQWIFQP